MELTVGSEMKACPIDTLMAKTSSKVIIPLRIALELEKINKLLKPEWAVLFIGHVEEIDEEQNPLIKARVFKITDMWMPKQNVDSTNFDLVDDEDRLVDLSQLKSMAKELFGEDAEIIGSLHRHPGTMTSYSSNDAYSCFSAFPISGLMIDGNVLSNIVFYMDYPLPEDCKKFHGGDGFRYYSVPVAYSVEQDNATDWEKEVKEKVGKKVYRPKTAVVPHQTTYMDSRYPQASSKEDVTAVITEIENRLLLEGYTCIEGVWNKGQYPINQKMAGSVGI